MLKSRNILIFAAILFAVAQNSWAQQKAVKDIFMLDRVSLALTGLPASMQDKRDFVAGKKSLDSFLEQYRKTPLFEKKLAEFWNEILKVDQPIDLVGNTTRRKTPWNPNGSYTNFRNLAAKKSFTANRTGNGGLEHSSCTPPTKEALYRLKQVANDVEDKVTIDGVEYVDALSKCGCQGNSTLLQNGTCSNCNIIDVNPFWNPSTTIKACRLLAHENYCGKNLEKCWIGNDENIVLYMAENKLWENLTYGFTVEPGMLIAKIVAADRPWSDVLTTSDGVVNGTMAFMLNEPRVGTEFIEGFMPNVNAPAAIYPGRNQSPVFTQADASAYDKFELVKVGDLNAGVLKTVGFQKITNGLRAKANRARESFLCKSFIPPDEPQTPSDETDLTKRPYCSHCHKALEPLSDFFNNWPASDNYNYDTTLAAQGSYDGLTGEGVEGLGDLFSKLPDFNECAVKRAFEFIVRRSMTDKEANNILNPLIGIYLNSDKKIWPVMKHIVESPEFIGSGQN